MKSIVQAVTELNRLFVLVVITLSVAVNAENVFVEVDDEGVTVFSDQKSPGAREITIPETMTFPGTPVVSKPVAPVEAAPTVVKYSRVAITSPENGEAIRENSGALTLQIVIDPEVQAGHKGELLMNGVVMQTVGQTGPVVLDEVDRGTNLFVVRILDKNGKTIITSPGVSISMLRQAKPQPVAAPKRK